MSVTIAVDIGGTFTDLASYDAVTGRVVLSKHLTTYDDFINGIDGCLRRAEVSLGQAIAFKHGTTLVINALLERKGSRTALVTTRGFRDVLEIGRGSRPEPFKLDYRRDPPLVPRSLRFELTERIDAAGTVLIPWNVAELHHLAHDLRASDVSAVAVSFLNSYVEPRHEREVAEELQRLLPGLYVTTGSELSREWYEYERSSTAVANAYVGPTMTRYLSHLENSLRTRGFGGRTMLMSSAGGVMSTHLASAQPAQLVESGPVGGVIGTNAYATHLGMAKIIAFDMGGTTAKCSIVEDGRFEIGSIYYIGGYARGFPIRSNIIDIVEVGAGGGSIAWIDEQGRLRVGPRSAGSTPGPVAYGRGGLEPTITDANFVLGRLNPAGLLNGDLQVDVGAASGAMLNKIAAPLGYSSDALNEITAGVIALATVTMAGAIKRVTLERGEDPREFAMFAYGGGGPLHAAELARELNIPMVIVPPHAGNFSAVGMLLADAQRDAGETFIAVLNEAAITDLNQRFGRLDDELAASLDDDFDIRAPLFEHQVELRYCGQMHSLKVAIPEECSAGDIRSLFEQGYEARFGHVDRNAELEFVGLRSTARSVSKNIDLSLLFSVSTGKRPQPDQRLVYFSSSGLSVATPVYQREDLAVGFEARGPVIVEDYGATILAHPGDSISVGPLGEIRILIGQVGRNYV